MPHLPILFLLNGDIPLILYVVAASPLLLLLGIYEDKRRFKKAREATTKWAIDRGMTLINFKIALNAGPFKKPTLGSYLFREESRKRYYEFMVINENGSQFQGWACYMFDLFKIWESEVKLGDEIKP